MEVGSDCNADKLLYGVWSAGGGIVSGGRGERLWGKTSLLYDNSVIACVGGGLSGRDRRVSVVVRRLERCYDTELGAHPMAFVPVSTEEMADGHSVYPRGGLHGVDIVWLRDVSACLAGDGGNQTMLQICRAQKGAESMKVMTLDGTGCHAAAFMSICAGKRHDNQFELWRTVTIPREG